MKPTKMRNNMIYRATHTTRSKQLGSMLSKDLQKKYGKRSVRVTKGDSVTVIRGEFISVGGKVAQVSTEKSSVVIEGIKKEQTRGEKYDVYIHTSNIVVKSLNTEDKWRIAKLENKDPRKQPKTPKVSEESEDLKKAENTDSEKSESLEKQAEKSPDSKESEHLHKEAERDESLESADSDKTDKVENTDAEMEKRAKKIADTLNSEESDAPKETKTEKDDEK